VVAGAATADHRRELLDRCTVDRFVLCDNVNKIFPIDSREQFLLLVASKSGTTDILPFTSDVSRLDHLLDLPSRTLPIARATLKVLDPENLSVPDIREPRILDVLTTLYRRRPLLLTPMAIGAWLIDWGRELHMGDDKAYFAADVGGAPLLEGKHIHQFVHDFAEPTYRLREPGGEMALLKRAMKRARLKGDPRKRSRRRGERLLAQGPFRPGGLETPFDQYRVCFREVARATDERTLIAAIVPPGAALAHSLHWFYRSAWRPDRRGYETILPSRSMVYVTALLNSLVLDFVVRRKAVAHVTKTVMASLPVADVPLDNGPGAEVVRLAGRLACRSPDFAELAEVLGVECGPIAASDEQELRAELDARVAHLYGLSGEQLEIVLTDFRQSESAESSPVRPNDAYKDRVRAHFARLDMS
jgi:hypothetical protein